VLELLIGEKNRFLNSGPQFLDNLLQVFYRRSAGGLAILILRDLQLFAQDNSLFGRADADLGAVLCQRQHLHLNFVTAAKLTWVLPRLFVNSPRGHWMFVEVAGIAANGLQPAARPQIQHNRRH
jgi:hypothetical protein